MNKRDTDKEIERSWTEGFGLTRKQIVDWFYQSNEYAIPELLKNETLKRNKKHGLWKRVLSIIKRTIVAGSR